jgi:hypothetical protein
MKRVGLRPRAKVSLMIAKILRVLSRGLIVTLNNHFIYTHREIPVLVLASEHSHPESTLIKYNRQNDKTPKKWPIVMI